MKIGRKTRYAGITAGTVILVGGTLGLNAQAPNNDDATYVARIIAQDPSQCRGSEFVKPAGKGIDGVFKIDIPSDSESNSWRLASNRITSLQGNCHFRDSKLRSMRVARVDAQEVTYPSGETFSLGDPITVTVHVNYGKAAKLAL